MNIVTRIIEEGVASGEFCADSPHATALVIVTLLDGLALALGTGLWQQDWNGVMEAVMALVMNGLGIETEKGD